MVRVQLCLKCPDCNKLLDSTTLTENNGEVRTPLAAPEAAGRRPHAGIVGSRSALHALHGMAGILQGLLCEEVWAEGLRFRRRCCHDAFLVSGRSTLQEC